MARTVIEIKKNGTESSASVMRRFSKRVRESGIIRHVKDGRYAKRSTSAYVMKKNALKRMEKRNEYAKLKKLGKIA
jgi:ribosomal protein S21